MSVVIPCYNYGHYLRDAVESVLTGQQGVDVRVLIIDDASTDSSAEVARSIAADDARVQVLIHSSNKGHIATYNQGLLDWADGDYSVLLSADDRLAPGALTRAARFLDDNPGAGFVYGNPVWFMDGEQLPSARTRLRGASLWRGHVWLEQRFKHAQSGISSPEVVVRTSVQRQVGAYNPAFPHLADTEMWLRFATRADVGYLHGVDQAYYRRHPHNMSIAYTPLLTFQQCRLVHDGILERYGAELPQSARLAELFNKRIASDALWVAARAYDRRRCQDTPVEELVEFALDCWPRATKLPAYNALRIRRAIGPKAMPYLQPVVLPGVISRKLTTRWEKRGWGFRRNSLRWLSLS